MTAHHTPHLQAVDWQLCSKWSSAFDLAWWTMISTNSEVAAEHEAEYVRHFHNSLTAAAPEAEYPWEQFEAEYRASLVFIFMWAVVCNASQFVPGEWTGAGHWRRRAGGPPPVAM